MIRSNSYSWLQLQLKSSTDSGPLINLSTLSPLLYKLCSLSSLSFISFIAPLPPKRYSSPSSIYPLSLQPRSVSQVHAAILCLVSQLGALSFARRFHPLPPLVIELAQSRGRQRADEEPFCVIKEKKRIEPFEMTKMLTTFMLSYTMG